MDKQLWMEHAQNFIRERRGVPYEHVIAQADAASPLLEQILHRGPQSISNANEWVDRVAKDYNMDRDGLARYIGTMLLTLPEDMIAHYGTTLGYDLHVDRQLASSPEDTPLPPSMTDMYRLACDIAHVNRSHEMAQPIDHTLARHIAYRREENYPLYAQNVFAVTRHLDWTDKLTNPDWLMLLSHCGRYGMAAKRFISCNSFASANKVCGAYFYEDVCDYAPNEHAARHILAILKDKHHVPPHTRDDGLFKAIKESPMAFALAAGPVLSAYSDGWLDADEIIPYAKLVSIYPATEDAVCGIPDKQLRVEYVKILQQTAGLRGFDNFRPQLDDAIRHGDRWRAINRKCEFVRTNERNWSEQFIAAMDKRTLKV